MSIKYLFPTACVLLLGPGPDYASGPMNKKADALAAITQSIRNGIYTLSLIPAEQDDQYLVWATWSDHGPADLDPDDTKTASHLALIRRNGSSVSTIWSRTIPGAFEPTIQLLHGNLPEDRKIVLLRYQHGGDEAVGTFFSLAASDAVVAVGFVAAQSVAFRPEQDNLLWSQTSPADPPDCHRLDATGRRLMTVACP